MADRFADSRLMTRFELVCHLRLQLSGYDSIRVSNQIKQEYQLNLRLREAVVLMWRTVRLILYVNMCAKY